MNLQTRTALAFSLRLLLRVPLTLTAHVLWGLSALLEKLGDGLNAADARLRPLSNAPFVAEWDRQISELQEHEKLRLLKALREDNYV